MLHWKGTTEKYRWEVTVYEEITSDQLEKRGRIEKLLKLYCEEIIDNCEEKDAALTRKWRQI